MPDLRTDNLFDALAESPEVVSLLSHSAELARLMRRAASPERLLRRLDELAEVDSFATLAAIESLAELRHTEADERLLGYMNHPIELVRRHAAWRLRQRPPTAAAYLPLTRRVTLGGIDTMHAHRTLRRWAAHDEIGIAKTIMSELVRTPSAAARARLVDTLGVVGGSNVDEYLLQMASDQVEYTAARIAAVGALSHRPAAQPETVLHALAIDDDELGAHAAIALDDLRSLATVRAKDAPGTGLRVSQLTLTGELDRLLSRGGQGDTGGVASLLVSVGEALANRDDVDHVLTISRGSLTDVVADQLLPDDGKLAYGTIAIGDGVRLAADPAASWEHLPAIERGIARVLRNRIAVDVLHLRMADVGTLAGAQAANELGIEICFSLAGDPHNVIQSMQDQHLLDRHSFIQHSTTNNFWFRARMVERLARESSRLALFPRSNNHGLIDLANDPLRDPVGYPVGCPVNGGETVGVSAPRSAVVPEGIDLSLVHRAEQELRRRATVADCQPDVLSELAARIPADRRHLPLLISVGRLNPIKGMDRVAAAWASDPALHQACTLVIVGGSLAEPTSTEQAVLTAIDEAVPHQFSARSGLILFGGRPRPDIALLLAAAVNGLEGCWAPGGTYVDGAYKEEFGLAVIEALAAGLVVTAPNAGGPPTYVEHNVTGVLVDPAADLAPSLRQAFALVDQPGRVARARELVEDRYSVETMAGRLVELYSQEPALL